MIRCKSLLACCLVLGFIGCQDAEFTDSDCGSAKCDEVGVGQLMPRAPETPGTIGVTRNDDRWLFEVIGAKGEILLLSENYAQKSSALNGLLSVEENGVLAERYSVHEVNGGFAVELRAANNELLADSQVFKTEAAALGAIDSTRELIAGIIQYKAALVSGAAFELARDDKNWEFALRDEAGLGLMRSQRYSRRRDAITGISSVRDNGKDTARYTILEQPIRFILKAVNGQEIAESSQTFQTRAAAQAAIDSTQALLISERVANPW